MACIDSHLNWQVVIAFDHISEILPEQDVDQAGCVRACPHNEIAASAFQRGAHPLPNCKLGSVRVLPILCKVNSADKRNLVFAYITQKPEHCEASKGS